MNAMTEMSKYRHEKVLFVNNEKAGLKAIIAVHNTNLGPAIGGCRLFPYASYDDALFDVLRLSRGMSHKNAVAGLPHGGGGEGFRRSHPCRRGAEGYPTGRSGSAESRR